MWQDQQLQLKIRQASLIARSEALRLRFANDAQALRRPLELADRVREGYAWLKAHPAWLAGLAAVLVLLRPRRALNWSLKLWWGWRAWQRLRAMIGPQGAGGDPQPPWKPPAR